MVLDDHKALSLRLLYPRSLSHVGLVPRRLVHHRHVLSPQNLPGLDLTATRQRGISHRSQQNCHEFVEPNPVLGVK